MRKLFTALLLTSFVLPLHAERTAAPPRYISVPEKAEPAKKSGDSRSFLQRIFGGRPTPTPAPAPTPAPVVKRRPKSKPAPSETTPDTSEKVTPKPRPAATTPPTTPVTPAPATTVKAKPGKGTAKKGAAVAADSTGLDDGTRFKNAKAKALEDAHIKELKGKADGEVNEAEARKALMNYNHALFQKIREVDPSVSDYAGRVEQSMTKRLGAEK